MDAKGRVAIPQAYRAELAAEAQPPFLTRCLDADAIAVYAHARWVEFEARLSALSQFQPEVQRARRQLLSCAEACPLDAQGRIRVPQHLREYAGLERQCLLVGVGQQVEIWDSARFEQATSATHESRESVSRIVADLGL